MTGTQTAQRQMSAPPPAAAEEAATHRSEVRDALRGLGEQETALVRGGRLREAAPIERQKAELATQYTDAAARIRTMQPALAETAPRLLDSLRNKQNLFQALLQVNLTVLATAHAVSEGIMRGVSDQLARKAAPQTYGASGRTNAPGPSAAQPLTVSRVL